MAALNDCLYLPPDAVECNESGEACFTCGWNPTVAEQRKEQIRQGLVDTKTYLIRGRKVEVYDTKGIIVKVKK